MWTTQILFFQNGPNPHAFATLSQRHGLGDRMDSKKVGPETVYGVYSRKHLFETDLLDEDRLADLDIDVRDAVLFENLLAPVSHDVAVVA